MINQTCCFTGHRRIPLDQLESVTQRLRDAVIASIKDGYLYFGAGGALGFDTLAAQTVLDLKKEYPQIKLILVLPCRTQTRGWKQEDIEEYNRIMKAADKVVYAKSTSPVYIFDEATSNIDVESEETILRCIKQLAETKTVMMITHRLANVTDADRIYCMDSGRMVGCGTHEELLADCSVYQSLWNTQKDLENFGEEGTKA